MTALVVLGATVACNWRLRNRTWFWVAISVMLLVHLLVIFVIPGRVTRMAGPTLGVAAGLDLIATLAIIGLLKKGRTGGPGF